MTKARSNSALIGGATKRPNNFVKQSQDSGLGPGAYKGATAEFGSNTKKMTIGAKRDKKQEVTAGPGAYNWETTEAQTRARSPMTKFDRTPARPRNLAHKD